MSIAQIAGDLEAAQPDLIPFFATGGIPFMFPAMYALADRQAFSLLDGGVTSTCSRGCRGNAKLDGVDSGTFFGASSAASLAERRIRTAASASGPWTRRLRATP